MSRRKRITGKRRIVQSNLPSPLVNFTRGSTEGHRIPHDVLGSTKPVQAPEYEDTGFIPRNQRTAQRDEKGRLVNQLDWRDEVVLPIQRGTRR